MYFTRAQKLVQISEENNPTVCMTEEGPKRSSFQARRQNEIPNCTEEMLKTQNSSP